MVDDPHFWDFQSHWVPILYLTTIRLTAAIVQKLTKAYLRTEAFGHIGYEAKQEMKPYYNIVHMLSEWVESALTTRPCCPP